MREGEREHSGAACVLGSTGGCVYVCVTVSKRVQVCNCVCVCERCRFTRAYSIFSVQQPAYMSAPLRAALAFWAFWTDSNVEDEQSRKITASELQKTATPYALLSVYE